VTRRVSHRAVVRVDPKLAKTPEQQYRARRNALLKQAREMDAAGDTFRAQMLRREADTWKAHLDKARGKAPKKRKSTPLLLDVEEKVYQARTVSTEDESGPDPEGYELLGYWTYVPR